MDVFCISDFKIQFEKLLKKKPYRSLEQDLIEYVFESQPAQLRTGTNLNQNHKTPFIKKRIAGSGGYRLYYFLIILKNNLYLAYIHPKTGSLAKKNLSDKSIKDLQKQVLESIKTGSLFKVSLSEDKKCIVFTPLK